MSDAIEAKTRHFAAAFQSAKVDAATRTILGFAVATRGPALGHGEQLDDETMKEIVALGNAGPVRCRINHPQENAEGDAPISADMRTIVGFATNFRLEGDKVLADCKILTMKANPESDRVLAMAAEAPEVFGASMVFSGEADKGKTRLVKLWSIDFVDVPAANPAGLFSAKGPGKAAKMGVGKDDDGEHDGESKRLNMYMENGKCYADVGGDKFEVGLPKGFALTEVDKEDKGEEKAEGQNDKDTNEPVGSTDTVPSKKQAPTTQSAAGTGKTFEAGVKAEREYAKGFHTAVSAAGLTGKAAEEFETNFYGLDLKQVKFLAANAIGARAKAVGESSGEGGRENDEVAAITERATKRFNTDATFRRHFMGGFPNSDVSSPEYQQALKRYVAAEIKHAEDVKPANQQKMMVATRD